MSALRLLAALAVLAGFAAPAAAQAGGQRCVLRIVNVDRQGSVVTVGADTNYFAGGNVRLRCENQPVTMESDSVAAYGGRVVQFIGNVRYRDSIVTMNADLGTYTRAGEKWEARGNVVTTNTVNGSTLRGPSLDYYRAIPGTRDTVEMYAVGRPRIEYVTVDSAGKRQEPYRIVGDRIRFKGDDRIFAGGKVTVDRSDFAARGDSLRLDTGAGSDGTLLGKAPSLKGLGTDSFTLTGRRIDLKLENKQLSYVTANGNGHAVNAGWDLVADTIALDIDRRQLIQTLAWGDSIRPTATSAEQTIRADSLVLDSPGQRLREVRAFGRAWLAGAVDSTTRERDWMRGDTVVAAFVPGDSAGGRRSTLQRIESHGRAQSYHLVRDDSRPGRPPSINYARGDAIVVRLLPGGREVDRVDVRGKVDGVQLEPGTAPAAPADSARAQGSSR